MAKSHSIVMVCALMAGYAPAYAENSAITSANNEIGLSIGGENIAYHEHYDRAETWPSTSDGDLDSQIGTMPALALNFSRQGALFGVSNVFLALNVSGAVGKTEYTGTTIYQHCRGIIPGTNYCSSYWPEYGPYSEHDTEATVDVAGKIGKAFPLGARAQVTPYVTIGGHLWNRNVASQNGDDYYWNLEAGPGVLIQYAATNRLVLGVDLAALESFAAHAHENGTDFRLGSRPMLTASLSADYAVSKRFHLTARYTVEHFRYGASPSENCSPGETVGPFGTQGPMCSFEPSSWTTTQAMMVGASYAF